MSVIQGLAQGNQASYSIANSVRLRASASAYFSRTFGTPTSQTTWTWSGWVKRGTIGSGGNLFSNSGAGTGTTNTFMVLAVDYPSGNTIGWRQVNSVGTITAERATTQVFRDPTAHFHLMLVWDTTNGTAADRMRMYVNGSRVTSFSASTDPSSSLASYVNTSGWPHYHGVNNLGGLSGYFDGLLSDIYFIDGQALTPSSFGEQNSDGVWVPKAYTGTFGNNGFWLKFNDGTSATTLGYDRSGNANNWTPSGISTTAGVTYDWMVDTPTNNYATLNPLVKGNGYASLSNGNLTETVTSTTDACARWSSVGVTSGKWYFEVTLGATADATHYGYIGATNNPEASGSTNGTAWAGYRSEGSSYGTVASTFSTWQVSGTVVQCAIDCDNGAVYFGNANTWINSGVPTSGSSRTGAIKTFTAGAETVFGGCAVYNSGMVVDANFGQRPFTYTPPTGFKALCTSNLPAVAITKPKAHFDVDVYSGTVGANTRTGFAFRPDLVWGKARNAAAGHRIVDAVRGGTLKLASDSTAAESTDVAAVTFNSDGYTMAAGNHNNDSATTYASWLWKANGAGINNLLANSQSFDNASWGKALVDISGAYIDCAVAPDGTTTADKLADSDTSSGFHNITGTNTTATTSATHTFSVYVKAAERQYVSLRLTAYGAGTNYCAALFNLGTMASSAANAANATGATATITSVGNGWYRCAVSGIANTSGSGFSCSIFSPPTYSFSSNYTGVTGNGVYIWGAQLELGSTPSTYIPSGSITSTVSANTTAGFSVVTWSSSGTAGDTVGHGLGVKPALIIAKGRSGGAGATNWSVYHGARGATKWLNLNSTAAETTSSTIWNNTEPTTSVFTVGSSGDINYSSGELMVAYCFAEIEGFSKFGSYVGNGATGGGTADGVFVYTGFRPRFVLVKCSSGSGSWYMEDSARDTYNYVQYKLAANGAWEENNVSNIGAASEYCMDFLANGFKLRHQGLNASSTTYIFAAFAEYPFGGSNVAPAPAR